jgi:hypothetical protein
MIGGQLGKLFFPFIVVTFLLLGCASKSANGPYNTTQDGNDARLMLNGHDPVAYHLAGKHTLGTPSISVQHDSVTYRFANENNRTLFIKTPERFIPQFGGYCANGIAYGIPWGGDGDTWKIIDGKLFIFGGQSSMRYFSMNEATNLKLADQYWRDEIKGSSALIQRYKRLILRVPHYQSGAELEKAWQASEKNRPVK